MRDPIPCRLCSAASVFRFAKVIMRRYEIGYFQCTQCNSLQTEQPYWIDEAYASLDSVLDVGRAQRNLMTSVLCAHIFRRVGLQSTERCLDWGGAEALFCRFMRDRGFNFSTYDKFAKSFYSARYRTEDAAAFAPVAVTAFEVMEHLPEQGLWRNFFVRSTNICQHHRAIPRLWR
jgi:hypothetical protein